MNFKDRQRKLIYFESKEFKDKEKARREVSKPTEHIDLGNGRMYCPELDEKRPEWMCLSDHGDRTALDYQCYEPEEVENE